MVMAVAMRAADGGALTTPWTYGFTAGAGALFPTSSLTHNFKGTAVFTAGLTGNYRQWRLNAALHFGQPSFKCAAQPTPASWAWPCSWATPCPAAAA